MCYEKSVNIFEQNMRERAKTTMQLNARLWKGVARGLRRKKRRLSKKMQNILLLNSKNSILVCTLAEF